MPCKDSDDCVAKFDTINDSQWIALSLRIFLIAHQLLASFLQLLKSRLLECKVDFDGLPVNGALNVATTALNAITQTESSKQQLRRPGLFYDMFTSAERQNANKKPCDIEVKTEIECALASLQGSFDTEDLSKKTKNTLFLLGQIPNHMPSQKFQALSLFLKEITKSFKAAEQVLTRPLLAPQTRLVLNLVNTFIRDWGETRSHVHPCLKICRFCQNIVNESVREWETLCCKEAQCYYTVWQEWAVQQVVREDIEEGSTEEAIDTICANADQWEQVSEESASSSCYDLLEESLSFPAVSICTRREGWCTSPDLESTKSIEEKKSHRWIGKGDDTETEDYGGTTKSPSTRRTEEETGMSTIETEPSKGKLTDLTSEIDGSPDASQLDRIIHEELIVQQEELAPETMSKEQAKPALFRPLYRNQVQPDTVPILTEKWQKPESEIKKDRSPEKIMASKTSTPRDQMSEKERGKQSLYKRESTVYSESKRSSRASYKNLRSERVIKDTGNEDLAKGAIVVSKIKTEVREKTQTPRYKRSEEEESKKKALDVQRTPSKSPEHYKQRRESKPKTETIGREEYASSKVKKETSILPKDLPESKQKKIQNDKNNQSESRKPSEAKSKEIPKLDLRGEKDTREQTTVKPTVKKDLKAETREKTQDDKKVRKPVRKPTEGDSQTDRKTEGSPAKTRTKDEKHESEEKGPVPSVEIKKDIKKGRTTKGTIATDSKPIEKTIEKSEKPKITREEENLADIDAPKADVVSTVKSTVTSDIATPQKKGKPVEGDKSLTSKFKGPSKSKSEGSILEEQTRGTIGSETRVEKDLIRKTEAKTDINKDTSKPQKKQKDIIMEESAKATPKESEMKLPVKTNVELSRKVENVKEGKPEPKAKEDSSKKIEYSYGKGPDKSRDTDDEEKLTRQEARKKARTDIAAGYEEMDALSKSKEALGERRKKAVASDSERREVSYNADEEGKVLKADGKRKGRATAPKEGANESDLMNSQITENRSANMESRSALLMDRQKKGEETTTTIKESKILDSSRMIGDYGKINGFRNHKRKPPTSILEEDEIGPANTIEYQLSNEHFVRLGWTVLPVTRSLRKIVQYQTRPAKPHLDWFKRQKENGILYYEDGLSPFVQFQRDESGEVFYPNGALAIKVHRPENRNYDMYTVFTPGGKDSLGIERQSQVLAVFDSNANGAIFNEDGDIRLSYNQIGGMCMDNPSGEPFAWTWSRERKQSIIRTICAERPIAHLEKYLLAVTEATCKSSGSRKTASSRSKSPRVRDRKAAEQKPVIEEHEDEVVSGMSSAESLREDVYHIKTICMQVNKFLSLRIVDRRNITLRFCSGSKSIKIHLGTVLDFKKKLASYTIDINEKNSIQQNKYQNALAGRLEPTNSVCEFTQEMRKIKEYANERKRYVLKYRPFVEKPKRKRCCVSC